MMQMIALTLLLYHQPILGWDTEQMGMISLYFAAFPRSHAQEAVKELPKLTIFDL